MKNKTSKHIPHFLIHSFRTYLLSTKKWQELCYIRKQMDVWEEDGQADLND